MFQSPGLRNAKRPKATEFWGFLRARWGPDSSNHLLLGAIFVFFTVPPRSRQIGPIATRADTGRQTDRQSLHQLGLRAAPVTDCYPLSHASPPHIGGALQQEKGAGGSWRSGRDSNYGAKHLILPNGYSTVWRLCPTGCPRTILAGSRRFRERNVDVNPVWRQGNGIWIQRNWFAQRSQRKQGAQAGLDLVLVAKRGPVPPSKRSR